MRVECRPVRHSASPTSRGNSVTQTRFVTITLISAGAQGSTWLNNLLYRCCSLSSTGYATSFNVKVRPAGEHPLDVYFLMDFSSSMSDDLTTVKSIANDICVLCVYHVCVMCVSCVCHLCYMSVKPMRLSLAHFHTTVSYMQMTCFALSCMQLTWVLPPSYMQLILLKESLPTIDLDLAPS